LIFAYLANGALLSNTMAALTFTHHHFFHHLTVAVITQLSNLPIVPTVGAYSIRPHTEIGTFVAQGTNFPLVFADRAHSILGTFLCLKPNPWAVAWFL
jgi:hypothetical protein